MEEIKIDYDRIKQLNNGKVIMKFYKDKLDQYKRAVEIFNDPLLEISEKAYTKYGRKMEGYYSLVDYTNKDRSLFWKVFNEEKRKLRKREIF